MDRWFNDKNRWSLGRWSSGRWGGTGAPSGPAYEDFTSYISSDGDSDLTITENKIEFDTIRRGAAAYVNKSFGDNFFNDFIINFEFKIDSVSGDYGLVVLCAISDISNGTGDDFDFNNDGLLVMAYANVGNLQIYLTDRTDDVNDIATLGGTSTANLYCTFYMVGNDLFLDIYSDPDRTSLVDSLQNLSADSFNKRYLYGLASAESAAFPADTISGYVQNFEVVGHAI